MTKMGKATGSDGVRLSQLLLFDLDYSRIEFAADARHRVSGCGFQLQMPCNEADVVKSAGPKGKLWRHIIKRNAFETG